MELLRLMLPPECEANCIYLVPSMSTLVALVYIVIVSKRVLTNRMTDEFCASHELHQQQGIFWLGVEKEKLQDIHQSSPS